MLSKHSVFSAGRYIQADAERGSGGTENEPVTG